MPTGVDALSSSWSLIFRCGDQARVNDIVAAAVGRGCTYFDVAPTYFDWKAMTRLGVALKPYRDRIRISATQTGHDA